MKIKVNDKEVFALNLTQEKCIQNDISSSIFTADMERRVAYVIQHKYDQCFKRLKEEWEPKLTAKGFKSVPTDKDEFAQLVFAQPDYKDRSSREKESEDV